jgi:hypothetical protein
MKIPILNGNGDRKKKRDLIYAVRDAMWSEYRGKKIPRFSFKLDNYTLGRNSVVTVTEYNEVDGHEINTKVKSRRHESPLVVGCLNVQDEHVLSLRTPKRKFEDDLPYNAVNICLNLREYKGLAYRIGIELEKRHYDTGITIEKKHTDLNMSLIKFKEIFEEI